jgi:hypothetical protein
MSIFAKKKHLGEILVDKKIISPEDLQEVLLYQKSSHMRLGEILIKRNLATEEDILFALSEHYGIPYQKDLQFHDDNHVLARIPVYFLKKNQLVPFNVVKNIILVGISDPLNIHPFDDLKMMFPQFNFEPVLTTIEQIREIIGEHFDTQGDSADEMLDDIETKSLTC